MSVDELLSAHRDEIYGVASQHGATSLRLFGSAARGESRSDSDIDLLVTLAEGRSLLDLIGIEQDLEDLLGRRVDVVTEAAISPYIRDQVIGQAVDL